jgi:hypothetical protein
MTTHILDTLGFEPIATQQPTDPRSLAVLGFEPATVTISARTEAAAARPAGTGVDAMNSRNGVVKKSVAKGEVVKGARVKLPDGALARVVYVDPNMRIARVRTDDGRNLTVRRKDLR